MPDTSAQRFPRELDKKLWSAADRLRANLDVVVYKHAVLGLIFLKYVSNSFAIRQQEFESQRRESKSEYFPNPGDYKTLAACLKELFDNRRWHYWISGFSDCTTTYMPAIDAPEMPLLVVRPIELVKKFSALAEAAYLQIEVNMQQSHAITALRDTLLPKPLTGELSVPAAVRLTEVQE